MDKLISALREYGADIDGAMGRFLDDEELYKSCFAEYLKDEAFSKLGESLDGKDYEKAFEYAHTLKGVTGNMGLSPMYAVICDMVEALRADEYGALDSLYAQIGAQLEELCKIQ